MQQPVTCTVRRCASARSLSTLSEVLRLSTERALVDASRGGSRERQTHVLELVHGVEPDAAHVLDRFLITDVVRALDGVVHVPPPVVLGIIACDRARDATLR